MEQLNHHQVSHPTMGHCNYNIRNEEVFFSHDSMIAGEKNFPEHGGLFSQEECATLNNFFDVMTMSGTNFSDNKVISQKVCSERNQYPILTQGNSQLPCNLDVFNNNGSECGLNELFTDGKDATNYFENGGFDPGYSLESLFSYTGLQADLSDGGGNHCCYSAANKVALDPREKLHNHVNLVQNQRNMHVENFADQHSQTDYSENIKENAFCSQNQRNLSSVFLPPLVHNNWQLLSSKYCENGAVYHQKPFQTPFSTLSQVNGDLVSTIVDLNTNSCVKNKIRRKTLLSEEDKRRNHVASEQKRRKNIRYGLDQLVNAVPSLKHAQKSEGVVLRKSIEYLKFLNELHAARKKEYRDMLIKFSSVFGSDVANGYDLDSDSEMVMETTLEPTRIRTYRRTEYRSRRNGRKIKKTVSTASTQEHDFETYSVNNFSNTKFGNPYLKHDSSEPCSGELFLSSRNSNHKKNSLNMQPNQSQTECGFELPCTNKQYIINLNESGISDFIVHSGLKNPGSVHKPMDHANDDADNKTNYHQTRGGIRDDFSSQNVLNDGSSVFGNLKTQGAETSSGQFHYYDFKDLSNYAVEEMMTAPLSNLCQSINYVESPNCG